MRVLVCPDKFRGTLTARQAAEAFERGWLRARPDDAMDLAPLADGGEGTMDALAPQEPMGRAAARRIRATVAGPLGDPVEAEAAIRDRTAVVELARASGLDLLGSERRDPRRTTTRGTGELIRVVLGEAVERVLVCLGGSATNDGGVGLARALGVSFVDANGRELSEGGVALLDLARIDMTSIDPRLSAVDVIGVTDVDNPLCGSHGASATYGPQKGASEDDVWVLDRALGHLAAVTFHDLGVDVQHEAGAGAAGGTGFGLIAFCGATLRRGVEVVMETIGFEAKLRDADLVVTGEGSLDEQSLRGKVPAGVLRAAEIARTPAAIVCGRASVRPDGVIVRSLADRVGERTALEDARRSLELVAEELAHELGDGASREVGA
jgi:glycerate 2-kinase